jgi:transcriptional regulator with XRE-family HTH domain
MAPLAAQKGIGAKLRALRTAAALSAPELASRAELTRAEVEAIERGTATPSVAQLLNLAKALGVSAGVFFETEGRSARVEVVRATERWRVERAPSEGTTTLSYSYEALSFRLSERLMQPFLIEVRLRPGESATPSHHDGEEFLYVLEGELDLEIGGERHRLAAGDSAYYDSRQPHVLRAASAIPPRAIVVVATAQVAAQPSALNRAF